jgi:hypothetical protein
MTFRSVLMGLPIAMAVAAGAGGAAAQTPLPPHSPLAPLAPSMPAGPMSQTAPLSLQAQLGAIPLVSPRALRQATRLRQVTVTQLSPTGQALGEPRVVECPETGCQQAMALAVGDKTLPFMADVQFVDRGAYVSLQARAVEIGAVVQFEQGRRGPVFLRGLTDAPIAQTLRFTLAPSATLRRLDVADDGKTLGTGNVYTRKRTPDVVLRVEIGPARERGN